MRRQCGIILDHVRPVQERLRSSKRHAPCMHQNTAPRAVPWDCALCVRLLLSYSMSCVQAAAMVAMRARTHARGACTLPLQMRHVLPDLVANAPVVLIDTDLPNATTPAPYGHKEVQAAMSEAARRISERGHASSSGRGSSWGSSGSSSSSSSPTLQGAAAAGPARMQVMALRPVVQAMRARVRRADVRGGGGQLLALLGVEEGGAVCSWGALCSPGTPQQPGPTAAPSCSMRLTRGPMRQMHLLHLAPRGPGSFPLHSLATAARRNLGLRST